jgi:hypothetical protein
VQLEIFGCHDSLRSSTNCNRYASQNSVTGFRTWVRPCLLQAFVLLRRLSSCARDTRAGKAPRAGHLCG